MNHDIDFVLLWVDGNDPLWKQEFSQYVSTEEGDKSINRFRDWDNLQYMFRSFEKSTPWVRKIHFVTWGHVPEWLNTNHPKLNIVHHSDFLKKEYLPVFNANAIECNIHRITGLAEHFVFFNDDTFVLHPIKRESFFISGLPCDLFALNVISTDITAHMKINNIKVLSKYFDKRKVLLKHFRKWFRLENGIELIKSVLLLPWPQFTGLFRQHLPQPFRKATFEKLWSIEEQVLQCTSRSRLRKNSDVNQYLFKWWQILEGSFHPRSFRNSKAVFICTNEDAQYAAKLIKNNSLEMICLNDHLSDNTFAQSKEVIKEAFRSRFPQKSSFEL